MATTTDDRSTTRAWIVTGPTSGIGRRTALALAEHGTVVLVGRDAAPVHREPTMRSDSSR